jgi:hypothetical protein
MRSGLALARFRRSQKKGERRRGQRGKRDAVPAVAKRTGGTAGRRSPISGAAVVLPNRSFLLHHQIRPGFLPPLSSLTGSETPRPAARRPGHAEGDAEDISPPAFSPSSFSLAGAWEGGRGGARLSAREVVAVPAEPWF